MCMSYEKREDLENAEAELSRNWKLLQAVERSFNQLNHSEYLRKNMRCRECPPNKHPLCQALDIDGGPNRILLRLHKELEDMPNGR
jgi:hypothetical protein